MFDPIRISLFGFIGIIFLADFFTDSIEKFYRFLVYDIDIINYREGLTDKLQYFTLSTALVLIKFF